VRKGLAVAAWALAAVVVAIMVVPVVWFVVDERLSTENVAVGVALEGVSVSRMPPTELSEAVEVLAANAEGQPITIRFADQLIAGSAAELGVEVDRAATTSAVLETGRRGVWLERFQSWLSTVRTPRDVHLLWRVRPDAADALLARPEAVVAVPVDAEITYANGEMAVVPSVPGEVVDATAAMEAIIDEFVPDASLEVEVGTVEVPAAVGDGEARRFVDELNRLTADGVTVEVAGAFGRLSPGTLRSNLVIEGWPDPSGFSFDPTGLETALLQTFEEVAVPGEDPVFEVEGDLPRVVEEGSAPQGCCDPRAGEILARALVDEPEAPVELPVRPVGDERLAAWSRGEGVVELVGEFTTNHSCCEARVSNIHRIADLIRGQVVFPGESFSVNEFVGERTVEKAFVPAPVIERGRFRESVGGGISQFATTFFNAAFFAGLDLDEYQSHSIYISRYPYGREATLSYPKPDLRITNSTAYPVLLWTSYSDTSITVSVYSTRNVEVEELGQETRPFNKCTDVETFRRRTFSDGRVVEDSVVARYRPGEGLDCNGEPTPT
jgi:vancomycin resistance protein YoaR